MGIPTLTISDPPHAEVDLDAAAEVLGLDVFAAGLKARFAAPEIMWASGPEEAAQFAAVLRGTGFTVANVHGAVLASLPWPDPVSSLVFDVSCMRATTRDEGIRVTYDAEVVGVYCRPPADFSLKPTVDPDQAVASGHGPMIAEAIKGMSNLDLYFREDGKLRRISIVPQMLELGGEEVVKELGRRFKRLRLDDRLAGVRPRARTVREDASLERRRYSFGTALLRDALESISVELREAPQYELGSRMAYALAPLGPPEERAAPTASSVH